MVGSDDIMIKINNYLNNPAKPKTIIQQLYYVLYCGKQTGLEGLEGLEDDVYNLLKPMDDQLKKSKNIMEEKFIDENKKKLYELLNKIVQFKCETE
jgi:hypothetical protein